MSPLPASTFLDGAVTLHHGDCLDIMQTLPDASNDSVVTDPPYALVSIAKRFGSANAAECKFGKDGAYKRASAGFMGKQWDNGDVAFSVEFWREVLRVLKPGGHVAAFGGTRTYHRLACAIEDAGFEIRDQLAWVYGSGFPKSHDVSKGIDKAAGISGKYGAPKSAAHAGWIDRGAMRGDEGHEGYQRPWMQDEEAVDRAARKYEGGSAAARQWEGWGTALKPAWESIILARKPLPFWEEYVIIGSNLASLEACLWSMLSAKDAAQPSASSQSGSGAEQSGSAQWLAAELFNTRAVLSEAMDMSQFGSALISSLNTVSSWNATWAEASAPENTSTIETELSTTIGLRTLKSSLSRITPASIILAHKTGHWSIADASPAERIFSVAAAKLRSTLELSALADAISQEAQASLDAGVSPNWEPICLARKPLSEGTVAANVLRWGTGAFNIDGCRIEASDNSTKASRHAGTRDRSQYRTGTSGAPIPSALGRWPANLCHDGSPKVLAGFPETPGQLRPTGPQFDRKAEVYGKYAGVTEHAPRNDSGSAARFFYSAKADSNDRVGSKHPTVKPVDLMQWLVRLITPPGGTCLDPFAGSGTTGEAAWREGFSAILIEREPEYQVDIARRMKYALAGPGERSNAIVLAKGKVDDAGPLFSRVSA